MGSYRTKAEVVGQKGNMGIANTDEKVTVQEGTGSGRRQKGRTRLTLKMKSLLGMFFETPPFKSLGHSLKDLGLFFFFPLNI